MQSVSISAKISNRGLDSALRSPGSSCRQARARCRCRDLGLVVHAGERDPWKLRPVARAIDWRARSPTPGRPDEAQDRALADGLRFETREVLEDAALDIVERNGPSEDALASWLIDSCAGPILPGSSTATRDMS